MSGRVCCTPYTRATFERYLTTVMPEVQSWIAQRALPLGSLRTHACADGGANTTDESIRIACCAARVMACAGLCAACAEPCLFRYRMPALRHPAAHAQTCSLTHARARTTATSPHMCLP